MYTADAHFIQGQGHLVCEDYAVAGQAAERAWGVVSDGCSGSPGTDVGARLLAHLASRRLTTGELDLDQVLAAAWRICSRLSLGMEALDATLGWIVCAADGVRVSLAGDGGWAVGRADGSLEWTLVEAPSGAPRYLSYDLCPTRLCGYRRMSDNGRYRLTRGVRWPDGSQTATDPVEGEGARVLSWELGLHPGDRLAVVSDGVFALSGDAGAVDPVAALCQLLAVPNPTGRFALRRLRRFTRHFCPAHNWEWFDDLSLAMVARKES